MAEAAKENVPFSSHLDELRKRLIWVLVGVFVAFTLVFSLWAEYIVNFMQELAYVTHKVDGESVRHKIKFAVISPLENFSTTMRVSLYAALVFAYPWAMLHLYLFVAPGLYRHERRFFQVAIPSVFVLFFAGAAFGYYVLMPISIAFLLDFNVEAFDVQTTYSLGQFLNLVFTLTFGLGFVFQIPLLVAPLIRFGLLSPTFFKRYRKYTVFIAVVLGAVISPTGLIFDMFIAGAPVFFLTEGGVLIGRWWRASALKAAEKEALRRTAAGETVDPEELAGGLAMDLEKKLKDFAGGGARKFARELIKGLREGGDDIKSLFDDNYTDADKPATQVKLKTRKPAQPKDNGASEAPRAVAPDQVFTPATPVAAAASTTPPPYVPATPVPPTRVDAQAMDATAIAAAPQSPADEEFPDRPWVEGVDEDMARYIEDRVSQRLQQFMEKELRPWMERVEHELRDKQDPKQ